MRQFQLSSATCLGTGNFECAQKDYSENAVAVGMLSFSRFSLLALKQLHNTVQSDGTNTPQTTPIAQHILVVSCPQITPVFPPSTIMCKLTIHNI